MAKGNQSSIWPSDALNTSQKFCTRDDPALITIMGMVEGDSVLVELEVVYSECDTAFVPFSPTCCGQMEICYPQNQFVIDVPNCYRLNLTNRDDEHINDPSWFENIKIVKSAIDNLNFIPKGCSDMSCGITRPEVKEIVELCLAANPDVHINDILQAGDGSWVVTLTNGETFPFAISGGDGIEINGTQISVDKDDIVAAILADPACVTALQDAIDTDTDTDTIVNVCEEIGNFAISTTRIGA